MQLFDILKICFFNLWRRKTRTILAILGVFIGIFSILATVSIGLALSYNLDQVINNIDGIRIVTIYGFEHNRGGATTPGFNPEKKDEQLNDKLIEQLKTVKGVAVVSPSMQINLNTGEKNNTEFINISGVNPDIIPFFGNKILNDQGLNQKDSIYISANSYMYLKHIYPEYDPETQEAKLPELSQKEIDNLINTKIKLTLKPPEYGNRPNDNDQVKLIYPKLKLNIAGVIPIYKGWSSHNFIAFNNLIRIYEEFMRKNSGNTNLAKEMVYEYTEYKKNKVYPEILVGINTIDDVKPTIQRLKDMGLAINSPVEMFDEIRKVFTYIQLILGGLGAISLLVATIGITNTTIMTIYERTKEIGIMKVIGANLTDIRNLFLFESGMIGCAGGLFGAGIAKILSVVINKVLKLDIFNLGLLSSDMEPVVSYMPLWLMLIAVIIATLVGLVAGYMPSRRAMKMSALESIKTE